MKQKLAIVAYDDNTNDKNIYLLAMRQQYSREGNYDFVMGWSSIQELIKLIKERGVSMVNELNRIIVLDKAFQNETDVVGNVNEIVSLEEVMQNRGVRSPYLSICTGNQELFDMFKRDVSPEGHDLFSYPKTRIHRLKTVEGSFQMGQFNKIISGEEDQSALGIRNDYEGRETYARRNAEDFKKQTLNAKAQRIQEVIDMKNKSYQNEQITQTRDRAQEMVDMIRSSNQNKDSSTVKTGQNTPRQVIEPNRPVLSNPMSSDRDGSARMEHPQTGTIGMDVNKTVAHGQATQKQNELLNKDLYRDDLVKRSERTNAKDLSEFAIDLRKRSDLNFRSKIFNDSGVIIIGGLPGSGVSSITANLGKFYQMTGKNVLIINLSSNDHITRYFKDFRNRYGQLGRKHSLMTKFRSSVNEIAVPVEDRLDLISDFGEVQKAYTIKERLTNYERIIRSIDRYDITLILAGDNFEEVLMNSNNDLISDLFIVSTQDELEEVSLDLIDKKEKYSIKLKQFGKPVGVVVNKIQYQVSQQDMKKRIEVLQPPIDKMRLISLIEYDKDWFTQTESGILSVGHSIGTQLTFEGIAERLTLNDIV